MSHKIPSVHAGNPVFRSVVEHFDRHGLRFSIDSEEPVIRFSIKQSRCACQCTAYIDRDGDLFVFRAALPTYAPEDRRAAMAEAVARANYGMKVGNFEMDHSDGEICFRTYAVCENLPLSEVVIGRVVACALAMCERYLPAFVSVMYGHVPPGVAIAEIESDGPARAADDAPESCPRPRLAGGNARLARNLAAEFLPRPDLADEDDGSATE